MKIHLLLKTKLRAVLAAFTGLFFSIGFLYAESSTYKGKLGSDDWTQIATIPSGADDLHIILKYTRSDGSWGQGDLDLWDVDKNLNILGVDGHYDDKKSVSGKWAGMRFSWSGWGGEGGKDGYEILSFSNTTTRTLNLGVYGYKKGSYEVRISYDSQEIVPNLKLPLPGGKSWLLTTEPGGDDIDGDVDENHLNKNHWSVDFSARTKENNGSPEQNVKVLAALAGRVVTASYNQYNGNYVVTETKVGKKTLQCRYLHLAGKPSVKVGDQVSVGTTLGIMGATGIGTGIHLHFGLLVDGAGGSDNDFLKKVRMEDRLFSSYQVGTWKSRKYYPSTNKK